MAENPQISEAMRAFEEFKAANDARLAELEKKGAADVVLVEKVDRINGALDKIEDLNQKVTLAQKQADALPDLRKSLDELVAKVNRPHAGGADREDKSSRGQRWAKAALRYLMVGEYNLSPDERKVLEEVNAEHKVMTVGTDTTGGILAPPEMQRDILKTVTEISPARSICRVITTSSNSVVWNARIGQFAAVRVSETGTKVETTGLTFAPLTLNAPEMYALVDVSNHNLEDSSYDLEGMIRMEATEQFAVKEGAEFCSGAGVNTLQGILVNSSVATVNSGAATTITADAFFTMKYGLKSAYWANSTWLLNRTTLGAARKLKDGEGNYLWQPGFATGRPNAIDGDPYVEMPDMPNTGAGAKPVAYGDFRRGYVIVDRIGMALLRDQYTQATSGNVRLIFRRRVGGQVVMAEAMTTMTCST